MLQLDNAVELDVLLPSQYLGRRRRRTPEHELMMAVIRDAFDCIEKYRFSSDRHRRRLVDEAILWFLDRETDWPYSFECICAALDLDPDAVRERLGLTAAGEPSLTARRGPVAAQPARGATKRTGQANVPAQITHPVTRIRPAQQPSSTPFRATESDSPSSNGWDEV